MKITVALRAMPDFQESLRFGTAFPDQDVG